MLKETFIQLISEYTNNHHLQNELWLEIEQNYAQKKRFYHTLTHLQDLLAELLEVRSEIQNWNIILFTLFYHDAIYNATKSDNEEQSAVLAEKRLKEIAASPDVIARCKEQILATKLHLKSNDSDINYFIDADLSILGKSWPVYSDYFNNVRKEYSIYPDILYKPGRKKVLQHFLSMDRIFKTEYFYHKFELSAKENLQNELLFLNGK